MRPRKKNGDMKVLALCLETLSGENRRLVADEPVEFWGIISWRLETSGGVMIVLEESIEEYASNEWSKTGRCQHVTDWI